MFKVVFEHIALISSSTLFNMLYSHLNWWKIRKYFIFDIVW
jgi:hypothetical protein